MCLIVIDEACLRVLGIQDICHFTSRDMGYYSFYFQWIWDTVYNTFVNFGDIRYLEKKIMGIFARFMGHLPVYFNGYGILVPPPLCKK